MGPLQPRVMLSILDKRVVVPVWLAYWPAFPLPSCTLYEPSSYQSRKFFLASPTSPRASRHLPIAAFAFATQL